MVGWWRDVIHEAEFRGIIRRWCRSACAMAWRLFIASEVMFFAAFFWAFFSSSLFPTEVGGHWPPKGVLPVIPWRSAAEHADPADLGLHRSPGRIMPARRRPQGADPGPGVDRGAGILFTSFQASNILTPLRLPGRHLWLDLLHGDRFPWLPCDHRHDLPAGLPVPGDLGHFKPDHHFGFEAAAWYWHFVDVVWLFLFAFVYIWGSGPGPYAG